MSETTIYHVSYWAGYVHGLTGGRWGQGIIRSAASEIMAEHGAPVVPGALHAGWVIGQAEAVQGLER